MTLHEKSRVRASIVGPMSDRGPNPPMTTLPKFMGGALTLPGCARKTELAALIPTGACCHQEIRSSRLSRHMRAVNFVVAN